MKHTCDINKDDLSNNSATNRSMEGREVGELEMYDLLSEHFPPFCLFLSCSLSLCFSLFYCSLSLHREVGQQKRVLMSGPSWRSVPKSKSSGAILQELPSPSWGGGTNAGVFLCSICIYCKRCDLHLNLINDFPFVFARVFRLRAQ